MRVAAKIAISIIIPLCVYYLLKYIAFCQAFEIMDVCLSELRAEAKPANSNEPNKYVPILNQCIANKMKFPATIYYNEVKVAVQNQEIIGSIQ